MVKSKGIPSKAVKKPVRHRFVGAALAAARLRTTGDRKGRPYGKYTVVGSKFGGIYG